MQSGLLPALGLIAASSLAIFAAACGSSSSGGDDATSGSSVSATGTSSSAGGAGGAGGSGGATAASSGSGGEGAGITGRDLFELLEAKMVDECGSCHEPDGLADAPFLAPPDRYQSITAWPGVVNADPQKSIVLVHPPEPTHWDGMAPSWSPELHDLLLAWLTQEASELPPKSEEDIFEVTPFKPYPSGAFNTVYLDDLGPTLKNASISFFAEELGGSNGAPTMLHLYGITVNPITGSPLHLVHPLFSVYEGESPDPDPVDSFSTIDDVYAIGGGLTLGTGEMVLTNWHAGAYLGLSFELAEIYGDSGPVAGCVRLDLFQTPEVHDALKYCANTCHGGTNPQAQAVMDLSGLDFNDPLATPDATCTQVRARITPGDVASSQITLVTDPTLPGVVHMYKFFGQTTAHAGFVAAVTPWIQGEGQ